MLLAFILLIVWAASSALYIYFLPIYNNWFYAVWVTAGFGTMILSFVLITLLALLFFKLSKPTNSFKHFILWHYFDFILGFLKIKIEVSGRENIPANPFCVYGNHKSMLDPVILYYVYHKKISAAGKKTLEKVKFMKGLMDWMGAISIDRENDREALKNMKAGANRTLENKMGYIIFPEGGIKTRETEEMIEIKPGAYKLAEWSESAISPVSIIGTSKISTRKKFRSVNVKVIIHKAITVDEYKDMKTQEIGEKVFNIVNEGVRNGR